MTSHDVTAIIFTRYSTTSSIRKFVILRANQLLISSTGMVPSGYAILHFILDAQLFLQPQLLHHKERTHTVASYCPCSAVSSASARTSQRTQSTVTTYNAA